MATLSAPASSAGRLTAGFQAAQARRAAAIAALVVAYYRQRVNVNKPGSVEAWLDAMVPRILREHNLSMNQAALFANSLRKMEVPDAEEYRFEPLPGATIEQVRRSLLVVGPEAYTRKATEIQGLPRKRADSTTKTAMIRDLDKATEVKLVGSVARHTQSGARETILRGTANDKVALGFVRVTRDKPCYFCAMLASRGLQKGYAYAEDSFDVSDSLFANGKVPGTAKVHDHRQCHLKPVYGKDDDYVERSRFFEDLYRELAKGNDLSVFRSGYNAYLRAAA